MTCYSCKHVFALDSDMGNDIIDHTTLAGMVAAGVSLTASAVRQDGGWSVVVRHGASLHTLATGRDHAVRGFARLDTVASYLHGLGILRFEVDTQDINVALGHERAAALGKAKAAAAYSKWLKVAIQEALDERAPPLPHEQAMGQVRAAMKAARP